MRSLPAVFGLVGVVAGQLPGFEPFDWRRITPTRDLIYQPCYGGFLCARLQVPMDWNDPSDNRTVALAIAKAPAVVPDDDPTFGGTVVTNPGGPGGSGVFDILYWGRHMQRVLDRNKHYEILSFDPRGVMFTTPKADCFEDALARDGLGLEVRGLGTLDGGMDALRRHFAVVKGFGALCSEWDVRDGEGILAHVSTAVAARDMVEIIDRVEELRRKEANERKKVAVGDASQVVMSDGEDAPAKPARLQYIGFSYGTILGNTFASMFPGRVGRLVVDGVADAQDYMIGTWKRNLMDTEKIVSYFYSTCFDAGTACPLRYKSDTSPEDIHSRVEGLIEQMNLAPVSLIQGKDVITLTGSDIQAAFHLPLYSPTKRFRGLATTLADALTGNYTLLLSVLGLPRIQEDACPLDPSPMVDLQPGDAMFAILCSDGHDFSGSDIAYYAKYVNTLVNQSATFGARWSNFHFTCSGWRVRAKWRFEGPFTTPPADPSLKEGVPAVPLLFLSSRLDPVTPLENAYLMARKHPGASVVVQDSVGHCAVASGWSDCTNEILRDYFEHGIMPKNGTMCSSDCRPWDGEACGLPSMEAFGRSWMDWPVRVGRRRAPGWPFVVPPF